MLNALQQRLLAVMLDIQDTGPRKVCVNPAKGEILLDYGPVLVGIYNPLVAYHELAEDIQFVWPGAGLPALPFGYCRRGHDQSVHRIKGRSRCGLCAIIACRARQSAASGRSKQRSLCGIQDRLPKHPQTSVREEQQARDKARAWSVLD